MEADPAIFKCERFRCTMRAPVCISRQMAKMRTHVGWTTKYPECQKCPQGEMMRNNEKGDVNDPKTLTRKCTVCGEEKFLDAFGKEKRGLYGIKSRCRVCDAVRARKYYAKRSMLKKSKKTVANKEIVKTTEARCNGQFILTLDFYDYQEVLDALEDQARINIRTTQGQALYYVVAALKDKQENAI